MLGGDEGETAAALLVLRLGGDKVDNRIRCMWVVAWSRWAMSRFLHTIFWVASLLDKLRSTFMHRVNF